ncbi:carboxyl transferase domain-containing protein [Spirillospora sp. NPDC047279]|uniref:carboxyl transferase domain-containing protein n=1 Tax=Spirillospora sp. NPDC047279 TaxID=3155478 RepID=UPI00340C22DA
MIETLLDEGTFVSWDEAPVDVHPAPSYEADLRKARERTGFDEAVRTGEGGLRGRRVAVMACEFGFLGGSIGVAAGERLVRAVERATAERLPLIALPASGGTRMQEGTVAFLQMVKITAAVVAHRQAGLPYLVYVRSPTTGGVYASWGSLGQLTFAEPGALIGFLGPRVYRALHGSDFPPGVQTAENLKTLGLVDAVVPPDQLPALLDRALSVISDGRSGSVIRPPAGTDQADNLPIWESVQRSRSQGRPGVRSLLRWAGTDVVQTGSDVVLALVRFSGRPCVLIGQDRHATPGPLALRTARRGMRLAAELGLPLVSVIDTPGAELSAEAEEGGLAGEIAGCIADLVALPVPTVSVLLGQGSGGAALALLPADRVIGARHSWLAPLPPEGASAIVYRDLDHASELAAAQGIGISTLVASGIADRIVEEYGPDDPVHFCRRIGAAVGAELDHLGAETADERLRSRLARYRGIGLEDHQQQGVGV